MQSRSLRQLRPGIGDPGSGIRSSDPSRGTIDSRLPAPGPRLKIRRRHCRQLRRGVSAASRVPIAGKIDEVALQRPGPPGPPSSVTRKMLASRVLPGAALVRASFVRVSAFSRVDLPTFDRPANAICATVSDGMPSARPPAAALVTKSARKSFNVVRDSLFAFAIRIRAVLLRRTANREPRTAMQFSA